MPSLKEVRVRIASIKSTQQITRAMKMVAAAKLRRAQDAITKFRPFVKKLEAITANIAGATTDNPTAAQFAEVRSVKKVLVIAITSDRGLCGGFNMNVIKAVNQLLTEQYADLNQLGNVELLCLGRKSYDYFKRRVNNTNNAHVDTVSQLKYDTVQKISGYAIDGFLNGKFDQVVVVYNEFKNVITQVLKVSTLLPITVTATEGASIDYLYEPSADEILSELLPKSVTNKIYGALLDSAAAEQGARMGAMEKATENAGELITQLNLVYNRTRQAVITREITEIVAGQLDS